MDTPPKPPGRTLLPDDVTMEELSWLLDNHARFHQFVDMLISNAEVRLRQHIIWESGELETHKRKAEDTPS